MPPNSADAAFRLWCAMRPRLRFARALAMYEQIERRLIPVLLDMERAGVKVDADELRRISADFETRMAAMQQEILRLAGHRSTSAAPSNWAKCCSTK